MKRSADGRRLSNLALIPALAITVLLLAVSSLGAQEVIDRIVCPPGCHCPGDKESP